MIKICSARVILLCLLCISINGAIGFQIGNAGEINECSKVRGDLIEQEKKLIQIERDVVSLLGGEGGGVTPITELFQVDLSRRDLVEKRAKELESQSTPEIMRKSTSFKKYESCLNEGDVSKEFEQLLQARSRVNEKKFTFLKLLDPVRTLKVYDYEERRKKSYSQRALVKQLDDGQSAIEAAKADLDNSENQTNGFQSEGAENILSSNGVLERYRIDLESRQIEFIQLVKTKHEMQDELQTKFSTVVAKADFYVNVGSAYTEISLIWRTSVDWLLEAYSGIGLPTFAPLPEKVSRESVLDQENHSYQKYLTNYEKIRSRRSEFITTDIEHVRDLKIKSSKLLRESGILRAQLLERCDRVECDRPRGVNAANLGDLIREIKVVPIKFLSGGISKWAEVKSKLNSGLDGRIDIAKQVFLLFVLMMIPIGLIRGLRLVSDRLDEVRRALLTQSVIHYRHRTQVVTLIEKLNPFLPFVGMIIALQVARLVLSGTDLGGFAALLYYVQLYFVYRSAKLILEVILETFFSTNVADQTKGQKEKIERSAATISRLFFIEYFLLHVTEDTVRRALAYHLFSSAIFWINFCVIIYELSLWKQEILISFQFRFPKAWDRVQFTKKSRIGFLVLPLFVVAVTIHDIAKFSASYLIRLDFIKRLVSDVFRKRLERSSEERAAGGKLPEAYLKAFDPDCVPTPELFVGDDDQVVERSKRIIRRWNSGESSDDLLLITGARGMGKTTALDSIRRGMDPEIDVILESVPPKLTSSEAVFSWCSDIFGASMAQISDIQKFDESRAEKILVCVDDIQNLFLGTIGGFEGYRTFLEIFSLKTKKVFWCFTVNSHSWAYLHDVIGSDYFYGKVLPIEAWTDLEIQSMILKRHETTGFMRSFDETIEAYGSDDSRGRQAETQLFRLLWGQSRGNPRSALMYWVSAGSYSPESGVKIGVPAFVDPSAVASMSDEALFILAAISRHECLTEQEIHKTTTIPKIVVAKCVKEARAKELVWIDDEGRVRISSIAQYVIDYYLIGKNFLYE